ncbi:MAG TPA: ASKHA domain-containing protein [Planctomycetota bacterium]|nr:ASKHA domain-containing protein [Planctomycetota bacterium]
MKSFRVLFQPDGRTVDADEGMTLLEAARRAGIHLNSPCGGTGVCGNCKVQLTDGVGGATAVDEKHFRKAELEQGWRLACQFRVTEDVTCLVPDETRLSDQKILETGWSRTVDPEPVVTKHHLKLSAPKLPDQTADADRIREAMEPLPGKFRIPLHVLKGLPKLLRDHDFDVTAVASDGELIGVTPGDTTGTCFGVAADVGTTTVVGTLVDLNTGKDLAVASRTNPQVAYGDDVVSRIDYAGTERQGLALLHSKIVACLNDIVHELTSRARVHTSDVYELLAVGNTTMMHLLLGVDPHAIAQAPYVAAYRQGRSVPAVDVGLKIARCGRLTVLPNVTGFVGADTVAVVLATEMHTSVALKLAIDIGTNGEIVMGTGEELIACSTAAGPAFEGARIKFGMRAAAGAIESVDISDDVRLGLIEGKSVIGICGTGLIDAVAELLRVGIIDETGRILDASAAPALPGSVRERVRTGENGSDFVLARADECSSGKPVYLTQRDVREVQLAKGALFAGIQLMKKELDVTDDDITEVLLAGAFGNYIRPERALRIGLLPDVPLEKIRFVGNAASTGARLSLVNRTCRAEAEDISDRIRYVELAGRPDFQTAFSEAMLFPTPR